MSQTARQPDAPREPSTESDAPSLLSIEEIQQEPLLSSFITSADKAMAGLGYTEHGFRHANLTARIAFNVLSRLGMEGRLAGLACIAGYRAEVHPEDLATIVAAVANHEEADGHAVGPVASAVILADKSDVHRSRVRKRAELEFDIHDRVNYAAEQSFLRVDSSARTITLELTIDTEISHVMEYFEIFLHRMIMCRRAAEQLDCHFKLRINGASLL